MMYDKSIRTEKMLVYDNITKTNNQRKNVEAYIGMRFGRLVVLGYAGKNTSGKPKALCRCDCGNEKTVQFPALKRGDIVSCGCYHKEELCKRNFKHGNTVRGKTSKLYMCWNNMICRCKYKDTEFHKYYIDKGVCVCEEWLDFVNFEKWALNNGYKENLTIDRVDSSKGYCPENCRWIPLYLNIRRATFKRDFGYDPTDVEVEEKYGKWEKR